jgi:subtilisin family serine protease
MRRSTVGVLTAALISAILTSMPPAAGGPPGGRDPRIVKAGAMAAPKGDFVPGELVVSFRPGLERAQPRAVHARLGATVVERIAGSRTDVVRLARGASVLEAARSYGRRPEVISAEPNWLRHAMPFTPNDTHFSDLWGLHNEGQSHPVADPLPNTDTGLTDRDIDVPDAWETEKGETGTVIAVIDDGVDVNHPDLADHIWTNPGESGGGKETNGEDDDTNGFVDDVHGWDFVSDDNTVAAGEHGTHVAGTIAGVTNNGLGIAGICGGDNAAAQPGCSIMPIRFIGAGGGTLSDELQAIAYARRNGAHVINGSFGGPSWSAAERNAFKAAGARSGILSVIAAGNDSLDNDMSLIADFFDGPAPESFSPQYPASYNIPHILSVAASNDEDRYGYETGCEKAGASRAFCAFSSFGRYSVDLAAPGVDILSTVPTAGPDYDTFNGTSMAAPHVSGVAGLLKSSDPPPTALQVKNMIMNGADRSGPLNTQLDTLLFVAPNLTTDTPQLGRFTRTAGRLNANDALGAATTNASPNHDGDIPGAGGIAGRKRGSVNWPNDVNDIFKKKLWKGKRYRMTLMVPAGKDYDLYLEKPGTVEIWQPRSIVAASFGGRGVDEAINFRARKNAVHYIHVSSWFTDGNYTLRARCLNC